jgi:transcriptional regulator with XRE-family HTH domain
MVKKKPKQPVVDFKMIREYIRAIRVHQKVSIKELALRTGYSSQFISAVESGEIEFDITLLFRLLDAMECELVIRRKGNTQPPKQELLTWEEIGKKVIIDGKKR